MVCVYVNQRWVGCEAAGLSVLSVRETESCLLIRLNDLERLLTQTWCREGHGAGLLAALGVYTWGCPPCLPARDADASIERAFVLCK
jgi:hypothetical protein